MAIIKKTPIVSEIIEKWYEVQDQMTYLLPLLNEMGTDVQLFKEQLAVWLDYVREFQIVSMPTCKHCLRPLSFENQICSHTNFKAPCEILDPNDYAYSYFDRKDKLDLLKDEINLHKQRLAEQRLQIEQTQANIDQVFKSLSNINSDTDK
jgi:hypothetical protein